MTNNVSEGHREKQSYANTRTTGKEQYYTNSDVVDLCIEKVKEHIDLSQRFILEPAGGTGEFVNGFLRHGIDAPRILSFDIEPKHAMVMEGDFLETKLQSENFVCITNPPFGRASSLAKKFFNHASQYCEYICFLVPRSWRKWSVMNSLNMNFHLISDTEMPKNCFYTPGVTEPKKDVLNTVFQIWKRMPEKRTKIKIPDHGLIKKILPSETDSGKQVTGANFEIITFGHSCGRTSHITSSKVPYKTTTMYLHVEREDVKKALAETDLSCYYDNVAYVQALSIQEINYKLNEHFGLPNFKF